MSAAATRDQADLKVFVDGLHSLGKHPLSQRHVYLGLNLSSRSIRDIQNIKQFPNLMYLDLSNNQLSDIEILRELPFLVQINLRYDY
jgi:hypothetical protein